MSFNFVPKIYTWSYCAWSFCHTRWKRKLCIKSLHCVKRVRIRSYPGPHLTIYHIIVKILLQDVTINPFFNGCQTYIDYAWSQEKISLPLRNRKGCNTILFPIFFSLFSISFFLVLISATFNGATPNLT